MTTERTYLQVLANTIGNIFGFTSMAVGGAAIGATTAATSITAGATTAAATTAYNQFVSEENKADAYEYAITNAAYVAKKGYYVLEKASPMLFSCGHFIGDKGVHAVAHALDAAYTCGKNLSGHGELDVSFKDIDDQWTLVEAKRPGFSRSEWLMH